MAGIYEARTLISAAAVGGATATAYGDTVTGLWQLGGHHAHVEALALVLDVTAAAAAVGDKVNITVQTQLDGTNWLDVARFTEVLGNGGTKRYVKKLTRAAALTEFEVGAALGAAAQRDLLGQQWRVKYAITDAGSAASEFTFSVTAIPG